MFKKNLKNIFIVIFAAVVFCGIVGLIFLTDGKDVDFLSFIWDLTEEEVLKPSETKEPETRIEREIELYRPVLDYEEAVINAVKFAESSVVSIVVSKDLPIIERRRAQDPFGFIPPEFRDFFDYDFFAPRYFEEEEVGTRREEIGGGTGFIVSENGLVVTNRHVVEDKTADYTILLNDGRSFKAEVIAQSPVVDLAVLKIQASELAPVALGDSDSLGLGQTAIAIGNALGEFKNTVSVGVISGLSRNIIAQGPFGSVRLEGVIQTDAAINRGNSGGPLLNLKGEVVGMNVAVAVDAQNIGFAIPINDIRRTIESVKETGEITFPFIGIRYYLVNEELAKRENLAVDYGALIRGDREGPGVIPGTAAAEAGLRAEDIILEIDGERIDENQTLARLIRRYYVGETVVLKILRDGKEMEVVLTLGRMPEL